MSKELSLRFDPSTIEHLGIKMYTRIPSALAELIANAYDADATEVIIELYDHNPDDKKVVIKDNGKGMSFDSINDDFLIIGRKKRSHNYESVFQRKATGRKGLGKLALFGIGKIISITSQEKTTTEYVKFNLDWDEILKSEGSYHPIYEISNRSLKNHGTTIEVSQLKRATKFDLDQITISIAKLFNFYSENFKVYIKLNNGQKRQISKHDRLEGVSKQFEWDVSSTINSLNLDFSYSNQISGKIISSTKPLSPSMRGITLYARGRQANEASFFGFSEAGHTFSYLTGWIDADFIDDQSEDYISTDRQQLEWEQHEITQNLQNVLHEMLKLIVKDWSKKRSEEKIKNISDKANINVEKWLSNVPEKVKPTLESLITKIERQPEIDEATFEKVVKDINTLIPEYTNFHYRYLHPTVQSVAKEKYKQQDYYNAFIEAMKRYKNLVKVKSGTEEDLDLDIVTKSFGRDGLLMQSDKTIKPGGDKFAESTIENIEESKKFLSMGIVKGGRNPLSHEEITDLNNSQLFTEKDCLDYLSILSHLFKRLDESEKRSD